MQTVTRPVTKTTTVVRAISSHTAKAPREFSFVKEDCFYMLGGAAEGKDFIEVIHPKLRTPGLVPAYKFEFVPTTALNKVRNQNRKPKNVLAYVTSKTFKYNNEDLEASKGDPVLILEEIDENFYFAKLIGKVGAPGRIHKSQVELKEEVTQKAQRTESLSSLCALRKNNSTGNAPRTEKMRFMSSRRSDSTPQLLCQQYSSWGVLGAELSLGTAENFDNKITESHVVLDAIPISEIKIVGWDRALIELTAIFCDSSCQSVFRSPASFRELQLKLLETFPSESGFNGKDRVMPYMPDLDCNPNAIAELNAYFQELLEVNALLPRCRPLLEFVAIRQGDAKKAPKGRPLQINKLFTETTTKPMAISKSDAGSIKVKLQAGDDIMAFMVKYSDLSLAFLTSKIAERLGKTPKRITYPDNTSPNQRRLLSTQSDLDYALRANSSKLFLIID
ncbi:bud emergence protein 1 [Entomophthora muscae]|uniref:Bud emergence protein 1 n=1 Tax=Entomophthora muscae TaxID=34485 RepID=A0ACC2TIC6_9FUNG|nr:bud emergence protein 1 [Entomophthora muscae]